MTRAGSARPCREAARPTASGRRSCPSEVVRGSFQVNAGEAEKEVTRIVSSLKTPDPESSRVCAHPYRCAPFQGPRPGRRSATVVVNLDIKTVEVNGVARASHRQGVPDTRVPLRKSRR